MNGPRSQPSPHAVTRSAFSGLGLLRGDNVARWIKTVASARGLGPARDALMEGWDDVGLVRGLVGEGQGSGDRGSGVMGTGVFLVVWVAINGDNERCSGDGSGRRRCAFGDF